MTVEEDQTTLSTKGRDWDLDEKGYLTRSEVKDGLSFALGFRPQKHEVDHLVEDGRVTYEAFEAFVKEFPQDHVKQIFDAMDIHRRGYLDIETMKEVFGRCPAVKADVIDRAFEELDFNATGRITAHQFRWILDAGAYRNLQRNSNSPRRRT